MPSRIAILSPMLRRLSGFGGITPWLVQLARGFKERGIEVDVLVNARPSTTLESDALPRGTSIINLGYHKLPAILALRRYLRDRRASVLLAAGYRYNTQAVVASLLAGRVVPVFLSVHENVSAGSAALPRWRRFMRHRSMRVVHRLASGTVAVSRGVADDLLAITGLARDRVRVIYNPIVREDLFAMRALLPDHPWMLDHSSPLVLGVGRLERQKDFATLIRAVGVLRNRMPCRLVILGEGSERASLERLVAESRLQQSVSLPGFRPNPFAYMASADIFVLSSAWEGFGNVLVEAMACGCPVVSTDCPSGPREILQGGRLGPLTPVGDHLAMADAIERVLAHPPPNDERVARACVFSAAESARQYIDLFKLGGISDSAAPS